MKTEMTIEIQNERGTSQPRILIADDQPDVLEALRLLLKSNGYSTEAVASPGAILDTLARKEFDVLLMDLNYARDTTSGREGINLLAALETLENAPPIVVMTGWATVGLAVEAMQHRIGDFVEKPWTNARLLEILQRQIALGRQRREARLLAASELRAQNAIESQFHLQEREIEEARATQERFLPREIPQLPGYAITGRWQPARVVGGDYFDLLPFGDSAMGICIGDVAGKGMPAALLMSNLQAAVRALARPDLSPEDFCAQLNAMILRNIASDRFITFFYAILDARSRRLHYAVAGHNPPFLLHADGSHERLSEGGGVLGVFANQAYELGHVPLRSGDRVVCYTDGITEASNSEDEEFGESRLARLLAEHRAAPAEEIERIVMDAVSAFCQGRWNDDATLVVIAVE
ncbi:MAG: SpoIIE family protein phosphatase [Candidatus Acidiferrales bacterium]